MASDSFWNAPDRAQKVVNNVRSLKAQVDPQIGRAHV